MLDKLRLEELIRIFVYLDDEEFWLPAQCWAVLIIELLINGFRCHNIGVSSVNVAISPVTQNGQDHHVCQVMLAVIGKVSDGGIKGPPS